MAFNVFLYASLAVFCIGLIYKAFSWFSTDIALLSDPPPSSQRFAAAAKGIAGTVFSASVLALLKVFVLDVLLQVRILRDDALRWAMHMLIYGGFMLLLFMHALESLISENLFSGYQNTLNPFLFLRDLFGAMVIVGVLIAACRRFISKKPRFKTNAMDGYALAILAVIILTGFLLEGAKFSSHSEFMLYAEEYADIDEEEEIHALESYWSVNFGLVSPNVSPPFDKTDLSMGREAHENYCATCHSPAKWAFGGYAAAKAIKPFALSMDAAGAADVLWYIHFLSCFLGLAYLPFSKMFHIIASPLSLMANGVMDANSDPANIATRQALELDACMHCGTCTQKCSAAMAYEITGNESILPSEKMVLLKAYLRGKHTTKQAINAIQEGITLCTNCDRCTVVCPAGINLKDLWFGARERLLQEGDPQALVLSPFSLYRSLNRQHLSEETYNAPVAALKAALAAKHPMLEDSDAVIPLTPGKSDFRQQADRSPQSKTYAYCFSCENCTTVCPVVGNYENPREALGMLPHQIMRAVGLGIEELAIGAEMLWNCTTCYQCQEHCPQAVKVTDVLYELKNQAAGAIQSSAQVG